MRYILFCIFAFLCQPRFALATDWKIQDDAKNQVSFSAVGVPGFLKINGTGGKASGTLAESEGKIVGTVKVITASFVTGIDARDKHMHEKYLGTGEASFVLDAIQPNGTGFDFSGKLTIKSDTAQAKGHGKVNTTVNGHEFLGDLDINLKDFPSIGIPSYMGVTVAEKVKVTVSFLVSSK